MKRMFVVAVLAAAALMGFTGCPMEDGGPNMFTVAFNVNGGTGTVPPSRLVNAGSSTTLPDGGGLSRDGYTFGGWNTNAVGTGTNFNAGVSFTPTGNVTLYARWNARFTVTFNANGGDGTLPGPQEVIEGSSITLPDGGGLSRDGYTFGGWNTRADGSGGNFNAGVSFTPTGNVTLYARWNARFTVTFDANGGIGTVPGPQEVIEGSSTRLPNGTGLSKDGYTFGGWNTNADGTGTNFNANARFSPTDDITLFARWVANGDPVLVAELYRLRSVARSGGNYVIEISVDETITPAQAVLPTGLEDVTITLRGIGTMRSINLSANGVLFTVGSGVTLVLDDKVTLVGRSLGGPAAASNNNHLVRVDEGGTLVMNAGSRITGNTNTADGWWGSAYFGGGVRVNSGGTFDMHGGEISGNASLNGDGGGVHNIGTFRMGGGTIYGDDAAAGLRNMAGSGAAVFNAAGASAQFGTFNGGAFASSGALPTVSVTVHVENGTVSRLKDGGLAVQLAWLRAFARSGGDYLIELAGDETIDPQVLPTGRDNVTIMLRGIGEMRSINLSANGVLFTVGSGVRLVLDGKVTLVGRSSGGPAAANNNNHLVRVNEGGTLVMNAGSRITGNTNTADGWWGSAYFGGGVRVNVGGTFDMHGGEISGNASSGGDGGGVRNAGTFRMGGGTIYGDDAAAGLRNTVGGSGAAVFNAAGASAQFGTFNGGAFASSGALPTVSVTVHVENGTVSRLKDGGLAVQLAWLRAFARSGGDYLIELAGDEAIVPQTLPTGRDNVTVTLRGIGEMRSINLSANGILFTVGSGVTLALDGNVTLVGRSSGGPAAANNNNHLVRVDEGGTLVMNTGSRVTGNTNTSWSSVEFGGGVRVNVGGTFYMHGGEISGNASSEWNANGGGVHNAGTFRMGGGTIYGDDAAAGLRNTAVGSGAAVFNAAGASAQFGTFNGGTFTNLGTLSTTNLTIRPVMITFDTNGGLGTVPARWMVMAGSTISLPGDGAFSRAGYTFAGWNTRPDGMGTFVIAGTFTPTEHITFFAHWIPDGDFTVSFNANGGIGTVPPLTVADGSSIRLPDGGGLSRNGFAFAGWKNGMGDEFGAGTSFTPPGSVTLYARWNFVGTLAQGPSLSAQLEWLRNHAQSGGSYLVEVVGDAIIAPPALSFGANNITVIIRGVGPRSIRPSADGILFTIPSGLTLVLDSDITLVGRSLGGPAAANNNNHLVRIDSGGTLIMNAMSGITGNTNTASSWEAANQGGGVRVNIGGTFVMNGGLISDNAGTTGGGVFVAGGGTLTMNGGTISGNGATSGGGGGVYAAGAFNMSGGRILNNTAGGNGGGVNVSGTFTMHGGEVSGDNRTTAANGTGGGVFVNGVFNMHGGGISGNRTSGGNGDGGGLFVAAGRTFTMHGGAISDNTAGRDGGGVHTAGTFTMHSGAISNNSGRDGGGVNVVGTFNMRKGMIVGNDADRNGGGVHHGNGAFTMDGGGISGNSALDGGGVFVAGARIFNMHGGTITANIARGNGGGLRVDGTFNMRGGASHGNGGIISSNIADGDGGGLHNTGIFRMQYGTVHGNSSAQDLRNKASGEGAVLFNAGTAEHVVFTGDDVSIHGTFDTTDDTIFGF